MKEPCNARGGGGRRRCNHFSFLPPTFFFFLVFSCPAQSRPAVLLRGMRPIDAGRPIGIPVVRACIYGELPEGKGPSSDIYLKMAIKTEHSLLYLSYVSHDLLTK